VLVPPSALYISAFETQLLHREKCQEPFKPKPSSNATISGKRRYAACNSFCSQSLSFFKLLVKNIQQRAKGAQDEVQKQDLSRVEQETKKELASMKSDIAHLKADMSELKTGISLILDLLQK